MALKYIMKYKDIEGNDFELQIDDENYNSDEYFNTIGKIFVAFYNNEEDKARSEIENYLELEDSDESVSDIYDDIEDMFEDKTINRMDGIRDILESYGLETDKDKVTQIRGYADLTYEKSDELLNVMRGAGLELTLEANEDLTFEDLYSEKETDIKVDLKRNDELIFKGFVKPDDLWQDFVNDKWHINLDCIDGLGVLEDLSFVQEDGLEFSGFMPEIDIIYNALKRTSLDLPINTSIDIMHNEMDEDEDVLAQTMLLTDRFYKDKDTTGGGDDDDDIMDCREVIESVLEKYCAVLQQHKGEWFIYRPIDAAKKRNREFFRYYEGEFDKTVEYDLEKELGSHIEGYYPHHAGENQRIEINGSVTKFRVEYEYGLAKSLINNPNFDEINGEFPGWRIGKDNFFESIEDGIDITKGSDPDLDFTAPSSQYLLKLRNPITVEEDDEIKINYRFKNEGYFLNARVGIKLSPENGEEALFYNRIAGESDWRPFSGNMRENLYRFNNWREITHTERQSGPEDDFIFRAKVGDGEKSGTLDIPIAKDGELTLYVHTPEREDGKEISRIPDYPEDNFFHFNRLEVEVEQDQELEVEGEFHTGELHPRNSSNRKDNKTVYNGDMESDIYEGVIQDLEGNNTYDWKRKSESRELKNEGSERGEGGTRRGQSVHKSSESVGRKKILRLMVEDTINIQRKPQKVFSGQVFGYIPFLSIVNIIGQGKKFFPISYIYKTRENIIELESNELFTDFVRSETYRRTADKTKTRIRYNERKDRGKTVKPAIRG